MQNFYKFTTMEGSDEVRLAVMGEIVTDNPWWSDDGSLRTASADFRAQLEACDGKKLTVVIDSIGGDVTAGIAMYEMLRQRKGETHAEVYTAYSSATLVLAGCDKGHRMLSPAARLLYHNPASIAAGDHRDIERAHNFLVKTKEAVLNVYEEASGMDRETLSALMDAETIYTAQEAVDAGFADGILEAQTANMLGGWTPGDIAALSNQRTAAMIEKVQAAEAAAAEKAAAAQADLDNNERMRMHLYASEMLERGV